MNQSSSSPSQLQAAKAVGKPGEMHRQLAIRVLETLIPVCVAVIIIGLCVAAFLLGGK